MTGGYIGGFPIRRKTAVQAVAAVKPKPKKKKPSWFSFLHKRKVLYILYIVTVHFSLDRVNQISTNCVTGSEEIVGSSPDILEEAQV